MEIFEFKNYRDYLIECLNQRGRGAKSALAQQVGCQTSYLARVLRGQYDFTLEQGEATANFLHLDRMRLRFFLLLLQHERAGSVTLRNHFEELILEEREKFLNLALRLDVKKALSEEDKSMYYSSYLFSAVHILASIPQFQKPPEIAKYLGIPIEQVMKVLEFLERNSLVLRDGERYTIGTAQIHLGQESHLLAQHHRNWRLKSMECVERRESRDLYYSSVISISREDFQKIREQLVKTVESSRPIIAASKEEELVSFNIDFFKV